MEKKEGKEVKTKRVSKLAVVSLVAGIAALSCLWGPSMVWMIVFLFCFTTSIVCGIAALIKIKRSNETLTGLKYAISGICINIFIIVFIIHVVKIGFYNMACTDHLSLLARSMLVYSKDHDGKYPAADKWCDLLIEEYNPTKKLFVCPRGKKFPSHYAMNPNAEPNSPKDVVLLFETAGGELNQVGGAELISAKNHKGEGCEVAFVGGYTEFVPKEDFGKLNWGAKK